ncbi:uncharacterized protein [Palaemon carinicauda]|uniref:uncharacterized protein n=1 Tax=Palaemon carinicauda TaxID=392227 RepID=UPI0035B5A6F8
MTNYYNLSLPIITATLAPLYASLKDKSKDLKCCSLLEGAFCNAKNTLSTAVALTFSEPPGPLLFSIDANYVPISAVLEQVVKVLPNPLDFFCRKLPKVDSGYSTFNCELLAVHLADLHFHHLLEGMPFIICTPLVHAFTQQSDA